MTSPAARRFALLLVPLLAILAAMPLVPSDSAHAHPLGNFTTNRYARIELYQGEVLLHYVLDLAEIPTYQLQDELDANGDGTASEAELSAFGERSRIEYARALDLRLAGARAALEPIESSVQLLPGEGGLDVARMVYVYRAAAPGTGTVEVVFHDPSFEGRPGWHEVVVRPSEGASATIAAPLTIDQSNALLRYPAEDLNSAPDVNRASFRWDPATGSPAPAAAGIQRATEGRNNDGLGGVIRPLFDGRTSLGFLLLAIFAAMGFGAIHALGPGHGKGMVAAYLVGSKGTVRHALALGLTVTATHTSTVWLMAFVTLSLEQYIAPERMYLYLSVAAGAMVVAMGIGLLAARLRRQLRAPAGMHRHGVWGKPHAHFAEEHADNERSHHEHEHAHEHAHVHDAGHVTWRSLLTLGVAGGLLPCPSALVVMLLAISKGELVLGMLVVAAFSLGLAAVLSGIGVALVLGRRLSRRGALGRQLGHPAFGRVAAALPMVSAFGVTLAGLVITYQALQQPGL